MSKRLDEFMTRYLDMYNETRSDTVTTLGEGEAFAFEALAVDASELALAVPKHYQRPDYENSLVYLFLSVMPKELQALQFDFLHGRYPEAGRTLRVLAEKMVRAFFIDSYSRVCPDEPDGVGTTFEEKLQWYQANERELPGQKLMALCCNVFIVASQETLKTQFAPLWKWLNAMAHPSAEQILSGFGDSCRHTFDHFDENLVRQLLAVAAEVFAVMWGFVLYLFPKVIPDLATQPERFAHCLPARLFLKVPTLTTAE